MSTRRSRPVHGPRSPRNTGSKSPVTMPGMRCPRMNSRSLVWKKYGTSETKIMYEPSGSIFR
ncbi:hypothetical protein D3C83_246640 [compost metagenome]